MGGVLKHVNLPTKDESANFDCCKMNDIIFKKHVMLICNALKNSFSIDRELAYTYVYIVLERINNMCNFQIY